MGFYLSSFSSLCFRFRHAAISSLIKGKIVPNETKSKQLISLALKANCDEKSLQTETVPDRTYQKSICSMLLFTCFDNNDSLLFFWKPPGKRVCIFLPLHRFCIYFFVIYLLLLIFIYVYSCLLVFIHVYLCLFIFIYPYCLSIDFCLSILFYVHFAIQSNFALLWPFRSFSLSFSLLFLDFSFSTSLHLLSHFYLLCQFISFVPLYTLCPILYLFATFLSFLKKFSHHEPFMIWLICDVRFPTFNFFMNCSFLISFLYQFFCRYYYWPFCIFIFKLLRCTKLKRVANNSSFPRQEKVFSSCLCTSLKVISHSEQK